MRQTKREYLKILGVSLLIMYSSAFGIQLVAAPFVPDWFKLPTILILAIVIIMTIIFAYVKTTDVMVDGFKKEE